MKITFFLSIMLLFLMTGTARAAENPSTAHNILIAYFSWSGNTRGIAETIHQRVGGDIFEIVPANPYPTSYRTCVDLAAQELRDQSRPPLATRVEDMDRYDVIFLGYPNWWASIPMPVATFLEAYDFSGKTIIPFCSHGGGNLGESISAIEKLAPQSTLSDALAIRSGGGSVLQRDISEWLRRIGMEK